MIERKRWPREQVSLLRISDEDKRLLAEVGLPVVLGLEFNDRISEMRASVASKRELGRYALGVDGEYPFWIDTQRRGAIVNLDGRYMNASVAGLAACLEQYARYAMEVGALGDDETRIIALIDELEWRMRAADPTAFAEDQHYWPVVIEQMRDGQL